MYVHQLQGIIHLHSPTHLKISEHVFPILADAWQLHKVIHSSEYTCILQVGTVKCAHTFPVGVLTKTSNLS